MTTFEDTLDRFRLSAAGSPEGVPLARLALLIAQAEYPDLDIAGYERRLLALSQSLEVRIHPAADVHSQLAELHKLLYDECAFRGNELEYNDPRNLYLNDVIERQTGIPVTLAIIEVVVAQRAGIRALPVGLPGRVVVRVEGPDGPIVVAIDGSAHSAAAAERGFGQRPAANTSTRATSTAARAARARGAHVKVLSRSQ